MAADDNKPGNKPPQASRGLDAGEGVRHDSRGNAMWQWAIDTGKHAIDSTSRLLKRLEVPGLGLEDDAAKPGAASSERAAGYDPYGTRPGTKRPAARPAAIRKPAAVPPARPSFWRRLFRRG